MLAEYITLLMPSATPYGSLVAIVITSAFAFLQPGGTRLSSNVQNVASIGIGLIVITLTAALYYGFLANGGTVDTPPSVEFTGSPGMAAMGLTVAAVVFTYDGWYAGRCRDFFLVIRRRVDNRWHV